MRRDADIVVVGAGISGVATARALADSLRSVVMLEQFELGHARGSSHGTSRIHRLNYGDQRFVRLAQAAGDAWRALEGERGERVLQRVGVLDLGPAAPATARALAACGVPYETLSADEVASRWPLHSRPVRPPSSNATADSCTRTARTPRCSPRRWRAVSTCASGRRSLRSSSAAAPCT